MGHDVSKTAEESETFQQPGETSAKEFSSKDTLKLETPFVTSVFDDDAKSKKSNSRQPLAEAETSERLEDIASSKPRSKVFNRRSKPSVGFSKFVRKRDTKVVQNFVGKFKTKFLKIDNVLHAKAESSVKSSSRTDNSTQSISIGSSKKSRQESLQSAFDSLEESNVAKIVKQKSVECKSVAENPAMHLEIFVDAKGGLKVDLSDSKKTAENTTILLKENRLPKLQSNENVGKKIVVENADKESNSKFLQKYNKILQNLKKTENIEETKSARSKRRQFCKSNAKNIENLGIKKSQELILLKNRKPKVENADKIVSNVFRKRYQGNKCDENIISLDNLMLTSKGVQFEKKEVGAIRYDSVVKFATSQAIVCESKIKSSLEVFNTNPIRETLPNNDIQVHKVLIRASTNRNSVKFDNPFNMFDMIIPEQLKVNSNTYKNSAVSLSSYTSQATENDVSDIDQVVSSATISSITKSLKLDSQAETDFCSSSEISDDTNVTKKSLQRIQGLTSFLVQDPKDLEYFYALQRISNPSSKLTFVLERRHKRKFKTLEELCERPIEMIKFLHRGKLLESSELEPIQSFISYEEILNSLVSGI